MNAFNLEPVMSWVECYLERTVKVRIRMGGVEDNDLSLPFLPIGNKIFSVKSKCAVVAIVRPCTWPTGVRFPAFHVVPPSFTRNDPGFRDKSKPRAEPGVPRPAREFLVTPSERK